MSGTRFLAYNIAAILQTLMRLKEELQPKEWTVDIQVKYQAQGSVGENICEYLKEHHSDEAILGQRPIGSFKKTMMAMVGKGSVSNYVVHHAPCSVVVVRPTMHPGVPDAHAH